MPTQQRTRSCPVCGTSSPLRIVYGLPSPDLFDDPGIALSDCIARKDSPTQRCRNTACAHEFGRLSPSR